MVNKFKGGFMMLVVKADIDELLKETTEIEYPICHWIMEDIEIDRLLEETKNWNGI